MGIGWEYFNNVCRALRVAGQILAGVVGLIIVVLLGSSVMQVINANRAPDATLIVAPTTTPDAAPLAKSNPQFAPPGTPGASVTPKSAASPGSKPNSQFGQTRPPISGTGTNGALPASKPNPQFSIKQP